MTGCNANTYSALRNAEDRLIGDFLARNQIRIITSLPEDDVWDEKDYYKVPGNYDDLYFHLIQRGEVDREIQRGDVVVTRYMKFQLEAGADTLRYWNSLDDPDPYSFVYGVTSGTGKICESVGWHEAVRLMKYPGSICEIIVPNKQGFLDDEMSVTPWVYIIKIQQVQ